MVKLKSKKEEFDTNLNLKDYMVQLVWNKR